jgi:uncharacterized phage-associated protein
VKANLRKLMQLIVFFAHHHAVKPLGKTKLFKLLFFTDVTHIRKTGRPITGVEYLKFPYGPVPTQGDFALKTLQQHRFINQKRRELPDARFMREVTALRAPDMTLFTEDERHTIDEVIEQYGRDTAYVLSWKSHQEYAWLFAEDWHPLFLGPRMGFDDPATSEEHKKNQEAIALLDEWYATPDDKPPGYWDDLLAEIEATPFQLGDEEPES